MNVLQSNPFQEVLSKVGSLEKDWYRLLGIKEEVELSQLFEISFLQDSYRFRSRRYALSFAIYLIDDEGAFRKDRALKVYAYLQRLHFVLGTGRESDTLIFQHVQKVLHQLLEEKGFSAMIESFRLPLCHKKAEQLIRDTIELPSHEKVNNADLRRAVLSAWLTPLRQTVGSCFATAPAILIQTDQPMNFLKDLKALLDAGRLSRTFGGKEHSVPLNPSWGMGDLAKPFALCPNLGLIPFNPGLIAALEESGMIAKDLPLQQKTQKSFLLLTEILEEKPPNAKELIRLQLLKFYQLTEEEIAQEEKRLKMQSLAQSMRPFAFLEPEKAKAIREFHVKLERSLTAFRAMVDNPLLKAWEFTLASFSDLKLVFTRWNLYTSLGLDPQVPDGLGKYLFDLIGQKLQECNQRTQEFQIEYERAANLVSTTEAMMYRSTSDMQRSTLQAELQGAAYQMKALLQLRNLSHKKAEAYAGLFSSLIEKYYEKFQEYFQELYDPEMHDVDVMNFNDSPAGFRLVYKHGRNDPSVWTSIQDAEQYIDSLRDFFHRTEQEIKSLCAQEVHDDIQEIITGMIGFIQSPSFLEGAFKRMALYHEAKWDEKKEKDLNKLEKKPWCYTSGGTMDTLLKIYYKREESFSCFGQNMDSEKDLFLFLLQVTKAFSTEIPKDFKLLINSPVHAFLFLPGLFVKQALFLENPKEKMLQLGKNYYAEMALDLSKQRFLLDEFSQLLPGGDGAFKAIFPRSHYSLSVPDFRYELISSLKTAYQQHPWIQNFDWVKMVDGFLYSALPLQDEKDLPMHVKTLFLTMNIPKNLIDRAEEWVSKLALYGPFITAKKLREVANSALLFVKQDLFQPEDDMKLIAETARFLHLAYPRPILFADTNWPHHFFSFIVGPSAERLELWVLDRTGSTGFPMTDWSIWFDKSRPSEWAIYYQAQEYS